MRIPLLLLSGLCFVGCDNQKPQKPAASPVPAATNRAEDPETSQANGIARLKAQLVGRWTNKDTEVDKGILSSDKTDIFLRNLTLSADGQATYIMQKNGRTQVSYQGKWNLQGDILFIDEPDGHTLYLRKVRVSEERLVLRNDAGVERIYDRIQ